MMRKIIVFIVLFFIVSLSFNTAAAAIKDDTVESKIASQFDCLYKFTLIKQAEDNGASKDTLDRLREKYASELSSYNSILKSYYSNQIADTSSVSFDNNKTHGSSSEVILKIGPKHNDYLTLKKICIAYVLNLVLGYYGQDEDMYTTLDNIRNTDVHSDSRNVIIEYLGDRSIGVVVKNDAVIEDIKDSIDSKNPVICYVGVKNISHWVLVIGYSKGADDSIAAVYIRDAYWGKKKQYKIPVELFLMIWKTPEAGKKLTLEGEEKCSNYMITTFSAQTPEDTSETGVTPPPIPPGPPDSGDSSSVETVHPPIHDADTAENQSSSNQSQTQLEILKALTEILKKLIELQQSMLLSGQNNNNSGGYPPPPRHHSHGPSEIVGDSSEVTSNSGNSANLNSNGTSQSQNKTFLNFFNRFK